MGRKASVRWYASREAFMCTYQGKQYTLAPAPRDDSPSGPCYLAALARFRELMEGTPDPGDERMSAVVARWLRHLEENRSPVYAETAARVLARGVKRWGMLLSSQLRPYHVDEWLRSETGWNSTTCCVGYMRISAALNWNVDRGYIKVNPLRGKRAPALCRIQPRGAAYVLDEPTITLLLSTAPVAYRNFLAVLAGTGARPGEIANAEDYHYKPALGAIVFDAHPRRGYAWKNAKKGKTRVIYLPPPRFKPRLKPTWLRRGRVTFGARSTANTTRPRGCGRCGDA
jgi:integrase